MLRQLRRRVNSGPQPWLSEEKTPRIALWIDTNCRFFGPTRDLLRQAMGEKVMPEIE
jgi:hypothetical protein